MILGVAIFTQFVLIIVSMIRKFCFQIKHTVSNYWLDGFVSETFGSSTAVSNFRDPSDSEPNIIRWEYSSTDSAPIARSLEYIFCLTYDRMGASCYKLY